MKLSHIICFVMVFGAGTVLTLPIEEETIHADDDHYEEVYIYGVPEHPLEHESPENTDSKQTEVPNTDHHYEEMYVHEQLLVHKTSNAEEEKDTANFDNTTEKETDDSLIDYDNITTSSVNSIENIEYEGFGLPLETLVVPVEGADSDSSSLESANVTSVAAEPLKEFLVKPDSEGKLISCMCGIFNTTEPKDEDYFLATRTFHNVSCHQDVRDEDACKEVCIQAAGSKKELSDRMVCSFIPDFRTNVRAFLLSKTCDDNSHWNFTGISSKDPICCYLNEKVSC